MTQTILSAQALEKCFGTTQALRGASLDVADGEVLAVMGPSGSGKSTLLHCLAGVLLPERGVVRYRGVDLATLGEAARDRLRLTEFGFVFQFGQLLPDLDALDNVCLPLLLAGTRRALAKERARDILAGLGLHGQLDKRPGELSGGQAQRVAIARAMVTRPRILFADEPTGSLDSLAAETVMGAMLDMVRAEGTTVVIITHDPRTAAHADREIILRDGTVSTARAVAA